MLKKIFKYISWLIALLLFLALIVIALSKYWASPADMFQNTDSSPIEIILGEEINNDFGVIFQEKGNFIQNYILINDSDESQKIVGASTSCGCTYVKVDGEWYGMHSFNKPDLQIGAHESEMIEIKYDPNLHGPLSLGNVKRTVTINSENGDVTKIKFDATVK